MKITFTAKIVADVSNDPRFVDHPEPTMEWIGILLQRGECTIELISCWDNSNEPTLLIKEID